MAARSELRSAAQGTGDRSDKIRTYNYPQVSSARCETQPTALTSITTYNSKDRISDHRISLTVHGVERVMNGEALYQLIDGLMKSDEHDRLANFLQQIQKKT